MEHIHIKMEVRVVINPSDSQRWLLRVPVRDDDFRIFTTITLTILTVIIIPGLLTK